MSSSRRRWMGNHPQLATGEAGIKAAGRRPAVAMLVATRDVRPADVLLGRGMLVQNHSGNAMYRIDVRSRSVEYKQEGQKGKDRIARDIVQTVQQRGGRFLRPGTDRIHWALCPERLTLNKVKQALRDSNRLGAWLGQKAKDASQTTQDAQEHNTKANRRMTHRRRELTPGSSARLSPTPISIREIHRSDRKANKERGTSPVESDCNLAHSNCKPRNSTWNDKQPPPTPGECSIVPLHILPAASSDPVGHFPTGVSPSWIPTYQQGCSLLPHGSLLPSSPQLLLRAHLQQYHSFVIDPLLQVCPLGFSHAAETTRSIENSVIEQPTPNSFVMDGEIAEVLRRLREGYAAKQRAESEAPAF